MIPILACVIAWGSLLVCWWIGDNALSTRLAFTLLYAASFALLLIPNYGFLFYMAQCGLAILFAGAAFGIDWLMGGR